MKENWFDSSAATNHLGWFILGKKRCFYVGVHRKMANNSMKGEARRSCGWTSCGPLAAVHFSGTCIEIERPWDAPWYLGNGHWGFSYVLELTTNLGFLLFCIGFLWFHLGLVGNLQGKNTKKHPKWPREKAKKNLELHFCPVSLTFSSQATCWILLVFLKVYKYIDVSSEKINHQNKEREANLWRFYLFLLFLLFR